MWLQNWASHAHLKVKFEKGMAGLIFKPHPPNFQNQYNFWRSSNDITMTFWYSYWFPIFKKIQKPSCPSLKGSMIYITTYQKLVLVFARHSACSYLTYSTAFGDCLAYRLIREIRYSYNLFYWFWKLQKAIQFSLCLLVSLNALNLCDNIFQCEIIHIIYR